MNRRTLFRRLLAMVSAIAVVPFIPKKPAQWIPKLHPYQEIVFLNGLIVWRLSGTTKRLSPYIWSGGDKKFERIISVNGVKNHGLTPKEYEKHFA